MPRILSGADFGVRFPTGGQDLSPIERALTGAINRQDINRRQQQALQAQQQQFQAKQQVEQMQKDARATALELLNFSKLGDTEMRSALVKKATAEHAAGNDTTAIMELLNKQNPDEVRTGILNFARKAQSVEQMSKQLSAQLGPTDPLEKFENILDAQGNVVAQRNTLTGEEIKTPRAVKPAELTSIQKNLIAAGFQSGTPEFQTKLLELIERPTGTTVNVGTQAFKIPAGFMINPEDPTGQSIVPIPGGKGGTLSGEGAKLEEISRGGLEAVTELRQMFLSGNVTQETLAAATAPNVFNFFKSANVQDFEVLRNDLQDMLGRLRSGGAITNDELATFSTFVPKFGDKPAVIDKKLKRLEGKFKNIQSKVSLAPIKPTQVLRFDSQGNPL